MLGSKERKSALIPGFGEAIVIPAMKEVLEPAQIPFLF